MTLIRERLLQEIGKGNHLLVISILEIVAPTNELFLIKGGLSTLEKKELAGIVRSDEYSLEFRKIVYGLSTILPESDFEVLKTYLTKLLSSQKGNRASELLRKCSRRLQWSPFEYETEDEESQTIPYLETEIERVNVVDMLSDWEEILWNDLFNYAYGSFPDSNILQEPSEKGEYLESILKLQKNRSSPKVKMDLFLVWSEQYAAGEFEGAYETAKSLRNQYPQGFPSYEYLFVSFAHVCQKNKIQEGWFLHDNDVYKKLVVYVRYADKLFKDSATLPHSLESIGRLILNELEAFYEGVSYDYVVKNTTRTSVQKREVVIKVFLSCWQVMEDFEIKTGHRIFEKLLVELLGGAKFRWMKLVEGGVENLPNYDAKEAFGRCKDLLEGSDPSAIDRVLNFLEGNLRYKIGSLSIFRNSGLKPTQLFDSCFLANHFFPDRGFLDLAKLIKKRNLEYPQVEEQSNESLPLSKKEVFDFTDKKIKELLSEDQEKADETSQSHENQTQVSLDENFNEVESQEIKLEAEDPKEAIDQRKSNAFQKDLTPKSEQPFGHEPVISESEGSYYSFTKGLSQPKKLFQFQVDFYIKATIFILGFTALYFQREGVIGILLCLVFLALMGVSFLKK